MHRVKSTDWDLELMHEALQSVTLAPQGLLFFIFYFTKITPFIGQMDIFLL